MKIVVQRVLNSKVVIDDQVHGEITKGLLVLVGMTHNDTEEIVKRMADKLIHLRIFEDDEQKMNRSLIDVKGSVLSISQFTLYANCKKGRRPSFIEAAKPDLAAPLYDYFNACIREQGIVVETGLFGADMKVHLVNDGPVTIIMDSDEIL